MKLLQSNEPLPNDAARGQPHRRRIQQEVSATNKRVVKLLSRREYAAWQRLLADVR